MFGGILNTLVRSGAGERPGQAFFAGGARYYGRFLRLTLYSVVLWVPALAAFIPVHFLASSAMKDSTNEQLGFVLTILRVALALFLVYFIKMIMDYARIRIVREDTNRVYDALVWAVRFVFGRLGGTLLLVLSPGDHRLGDAGGLSRSAPALPGATTGAVVSGFLLTQALRRRPGVAEDRFPGGADLELSSRA